MLRVVHSLCILCVRTLDRLERKLARIELRGWQLTALSNAIAKYESGGRVFVAGVSVGGGKTIFGAAVASEMLGIGLVDTIAVVTPSAQIQCGWSDRMTSTFRLSIRHSDGNADLRFKDGIPRSEHGYSTTYQSVDANPLQHRILATKRLGYSNARTLLILDEAHHIGIDAAGKPTTWAKSILEAFGDVQYVLVLTGTPGRSDGSKIPFVTYVGGQAEIDFKYSYGRAAKSGIVRRCAFSPVEAVGKVELGDVASIASTGDTRSRARSAIEAAALNVRPELASGNGEVGIAAETILDKAIRELDRIRPHHPRAAALAVCDNVKHAEYIGQCLAARGERHVVVTSDDAKAADLINAFRTNGTPWIVAVQMVAEGVDIPRLRVCAYLTRRRTPLALEQIMGRVVRVDWHDDNKNKYGERQRVDDVTGQDIAPGEAVFVHLNKPELLEWSRQVENEMAAAAKEDVDDEENTGTGTGTRGGGEAEIYEVYGMRAESKGETIGGLNFSQEIAELAEDFRQQEPNLTRLAANKLAAAAARKYGRDGSPHQARAVHPQEPERTQAQRLRKSSDKNAKRVAKRYGVEPRDVHVWANNCVGIEGVATATLAQLIEKDRILGSGEFPGAPFGSGRNGR